MRTQWHHTNTEICQTDSVLSTAEDMDPVRVHSSKGECGTLSNAYDTLYPWSRALCQSSTTLISADVVEQLDMKPLCLADISAFTLYNSSTTGFLLWHSISLLTIGSTEIGQYPDGSKSLVPLDIGVILPIFQSVGSVPVDVDINSLCDGSVILRGVHLSILMRFHHYIPVDLAVSRFESSFKKNCLSSQ